MSPGQQEGSEPRARLANDRPKIEPTVVPTPAQFFAHSLRKHHTTIHFRKDIDFLNQNGIIDRRPMGYDNDPKGGSLVGSGPFRFAHERSNVTRSRSKSERSL